MITIPFTFPFVSCSCPSLPNGPRTIKNRFLVILLYGCVLAKVMCTVHRYHSFVEEWVICIVIFIHAGVESLMVNHFGRIQNPCSAGPCRRHRQAGCQIPHLDTYGNTAAHVPCPSQGEPTPPPPGPTLPEVRAGVTLHRTLCYGRSILLLSHLRPSVVLRREIPR